MNEVEKAIFVFVNTREKVEVLTKMRALLNMESALNNSFKFPSGIETKEQFRFIVINDLTLRISNIAATSLVLKEEKM